MCHGLIFAEEKDLPLGNNNGKLVPEFDAREMTEPGRVRARCRRAHVTFVETRISCLIGCVLTNLNFNHCLLAAVRRPLSDYGVSACVKSVLDGCLNQRLITRQLTSGVGASSVPFRAPPKVASHS